MHIQPPCKARIRRWILRDARWLIWLTLVILVTACSGNQSIKPWADLQLPGVTKIPGIENLQKNSDIDRVYHAITYQSQLDGDATHVLFENGQAVYDMRLDGIQLHTVTLPCSESVAVAPGGQWIACRTNTDIVMHDFTAHQADITLSDAGQYPGYPTWAPDGHHLAIMTSLGGGCSIGIFDISFTTGSTHLVALLSLPRFVTEESDNVGCSVYLTWSPDGTQFAFIDTDLWALYDLPIGSLHLLTRPETLPPITQAMTGDQLIRLGEKCRSHSGLAWAATSKALTYVACTGRTIKQTDIVTHETTTLLVQGAAGVFDLSWTPDGKRLLFVLGIASDELTPPPSQLYVYTPSET